MDQGETLKHVRKMFQENVKVEAQPAQKIESS